MAIPTRVAVIGVGDALRRDDGVALAVVAALRERAATCPLPPGTAVATCDGDPGRLIRLWAGADLAVVLDTAQARAAVPARVRRRELDAADFRPFLPARSCSCSRARALGLGEAVELARALGRLPDRLVEYAVEGAARTRGTGLSPAVAALVEPLARSVEAEIGRHRAASAARG